MLRLRTYIPDNMSSGARSNACAPLILPRYDAGIQTFDTADVYSNGLSEIILGNSIRKLNLPRQELVIMTKVCLLYSALCVGLTQSRSCTRLLRPSLGLTTTIRVSQRSTGS